MLRSLKISMVLIENQRGSNDWTPQKGERKQKRDIADDYSSQKIREEILTTALCAQSRI